MTDYAKTFNTSNKVVSVMSPDFLRRNLSGPLNLCRQTGRKVTHVGHVRGLWIRARKTSSLMHKVEKTTNRAVPAFRVAMIHDYHNFLTIIYLFPTNSGGVSWHVRQRKG